MIESLVQYLNDHAEIFYSLIRRFVNYTPIKESALVLDDELAAQTKEILKNNGFPLKTGRNCLIIRKSDKVDLIILNEKNRLFKQVRVSVGECEGYNCLNERDTYLTIG